MTRMTRTVSGVSAAVLFAAAAAVVGSISFPGRAAGRLWEFGSAVKESGLAALSPEARVAVERLASARNETVGAALTGVERVMADARQAVARKDLLAGSGRWRGGRYDREDKTWRAQVERDRADGSIAGSISVVGSVLLGPSARVSGRVEGRNVSGVISGDEGQQLATFRGRLGKDGLASGTYTTIDGETGDWSHGDLGW